MGQLHGRRQAHGPASGDQYGHGVRNLPYRIHGTGIFLAPFAHRQAGPVRTRAAR
ncbi:unnamed protein product [[Actinomadura] parvosata subsp. kistnae]|nr:unnamed protein product [Actinomadura parvosata subsp. kistnae]